MTKKKNNEEIIEETAEETCQCEKEKCCCGQECDCGDDCKCGDGECHCGDCHCDDDKCDCDDKNCQCDCDREKNQAAEYLALAQRLQADFENYRKRVAEQLDREKQEGVKSVIEVFLPCLDTFKEAKKSIADEKVIAGINMIEDKILNALATLHVEKINSIGEKFDPHLHNVIAMLNNPEVDDDVILEEYQSGWTLNGKVIRYAKVIVNKKQN